MTQFRPNRAKLKLAQGLPVVAVAGLADANAIDAIGPTGVDAVWIEGEHGPFDFGSLPDLTRACDLWGMTSIVRVNEKGYGPLYRSLDLGAQGIAVPHIDTAEEARDFVAATKFAPIGRRGVASGRQGHGVANYFRDANDHTLLVAFIEDIKAIEVLNTILAVDHIDVFFIAPSDLAASLGHIGQNEHPDVVRVRDDALRRVIKAGRTAGALANTNEEIDHFLPMGVNFFMTSAQGWMQRAAVDMLSRVDALQRRRAASAG